MLWNDVRSGQSKALGSLTGTFGPNHFYETYPTLMKSNDFEKLEALAHNHMASGSLDSHQGSSRLERSASRRTLRV